MRILFLLLLTMWQLTCIGMSGDSFNESGSYSQNIKNLELIICYSEQKNTSHIPFHTLYTKKINDKNETEYQFSCPNQCNDTYKTKINTIKKYSLQLKNPTVTSMITILKNKAISHLKKCSAKPLIQFHDQPDENYLKNRFSDLYNLLKKRSNKNNTLPEKKKRKKNNNSNDNLNT